MEASAGELAIGGRPASALVAEAGGTPLFVYSLERVKQRVADLRAALPERVAVHYALKANSTLGIARLLRSLGAAADANSVGEIDVALRAGYSPAEMVFTGVGKTGLASALLLKALQNGHRGLFVLAQDLFDEMYASLADRSSRKLIDRLARVDVLVVDEMGYLNLKPEQTNIFFKLMEERYRRRSTIITTNLEYDEWHNFLGNKALVDALLSRLRHQCHTVRIEGPSLRDPQG